MNPSEQVSEQAREGRRLVRSVESGILSTLSIELPGYPFGSVVPYATLPTGEPVLYVSSIAQHTKNMLADPRVSLTVVESGDGNAQALGRVTLLGDARRVPADRLEHARERYFRFFPQARAYAGTHDFTCFLIETLRVRYIGGFGKIFWVEAEDWRLPEPDWTAGEVGMLEHMNGDHQAALTHMLETRGADAASEQQLVGIDPEGTHLAAAGAIHYFPFTEAAFDADAVRREMVQLARS